MNKSTLITALLIFTMILTMTTGLITPGTVSAIEEGEPEIDGVFEIYVEDFILDLNNDRSEEELIELFIAIEFWRLKMYGPYKDVSTDALLLASYDFMEVVRFIYNNKANVPNFSFDKKIRVHFDDRPILVQWPVDESASNSTNFPGSTRISNILENQCQRIESRYSCPPDALRMIGVTTLNNSNSADGGDDTFWENAWDTLDNVKEQVGGMIDEVEGWLDDLKNETTFPCGEGEVTADIGIDGDTCSSVADLNASYPLWNGDFKLSLYGHVTGHSIEDDMNYDVEDWKVGARFKYTQDLFSGNASAVFQADLNTDDEGDVGGKVSAGIQVGGVNISLFVMD